jgi:hypothetical protein
MRITMLDQMAGTPISVENRGAYGGSRNSQKSG